MDHIRPQFQLFNKCDIFFYVRVSFEVTSTKMRNNDNL